MRLRPCCKVACKAHESTAEGSRSSCAPSRCSLDILRNLRTSGQRTNAVSGDRAQAACRRLKAHIQHKQCAPRVIQPPREVPPDGFTACSCQVRCTAM